MKQYIKDESLPLDNSYRSGLDGAHMHVKRWCSGGFKVSIIAKACFRDYIHIETDLNSFVSCVVQKLVMSKLLYLQSADTRKP